MCFSGLINVLTSETYVCTLVLVIGVSVIGISTILAFFFKQYLTKQGKIRRRTLKKSILSPTFIGQGRGRMKVEDGGMEGEGKEQEGTGKEEESEGKREGGRGKEEGGDDMFSFNKINEFEDYSVGNSPGQRNHDNKEEFAGFKLIPLDQVKKTEIVTAGDHEEGEEEKIEEIQLAEEQKEIVNFFISYK